MLNKPFLVVEAFATYLSISTALTKENGVPVRK